MVLAEVRQDPRALIEAFDDPILALLGGTDTQGDIRQNATLQEIPSDKIDIRAGLAPQKAQGPIVQPHACVLLEVFRGLLTLKWA